MTMGETIMWLVANPGREVIRRFSNIHYRLSGVVFEQYDAGAVEPGWTPCRAESMLFDNGKEFLIWEPADVMEAHARNRKN